MRDEGEVLVDLVGVVTGDTNMIGVNKNNFSVGSLTGKERLLLLIWLSSTLKLFCTSRKGSNSCDVTVTLMRCVKLSFVDVVPATGSSTQV